MICRRWKTLVLICRVIPDEKLLISYGMYNPIMVIGSQISFFKYFADINSKIKILLYLSFHVLYISFGVIMQMEQ